MKHKNGVFRSFIGQSWQIDTTATQIVYKNNEKTGKIEYVDLVGITIKQGLVSDTIVVRYGKNHLFISNFSAADALRLRDDVVNSAKKSIASTINKYPKQILELSSHIDQFLAEQRYLAQSDIRGWLGTVPEIGALLSHPFFEVNYLEKRFRDSLRLLQDIKSPNSTTLKNRNDTFVQQAIQNFSNIFNRLEKHPLTIEQKRAAVIDEDRNLLIAAAGSGKSSTIVAKAAYLVESKLATPEEILILAYNKDAQLEIEERITQAFGKLGKKKGTPLTKTFHSIGLDIVAANTGKKPKISKLASARGKTANAIFSDLIKCISSRDTIFYTNWAQYITIAKHPLPEHESIKTKEDYERFLIQIGAKKTGPIGRQSMTLTTIDNNEVKSLQELRIYNWLTIMGVDFKYERPYELDTADILHSQYQPDFFYPEANLYHEHFALDANGSPPAFMTGYFEGVTWKRNLHEKRSTKLFETHSADFNSGLIFEKLEKELRQAGVSFKPLGKEKLDELVQNSFDIEHDTKLFVTFLRHFKSNAFSIDELKKKFEAAGDKFRANLFLSVFEHIYLEYQQRLFDKGEIDFEDQVNLASQFLEEQAVVHSWKYVLVDEFQDISRDRYRLIQALLLHDDHMKLFAVGDDWQSIYRFAGADIDIMTNFGTHFGTTAQSNLTNTFRSYQGLIDVAGSFVQKNPNQLRKKVEAVKKDVGAKQVIIKEYSDESDQTQQVLALLEEIAKKGKSNKTKLTIFIMARYNFQLPRSQSKFKAFSSTLDIICTTVHASKGLEADYVLLLNVSNEKFGFPSLIEDDPLVRLVLPKAEDFPYAEERRLFYVALTRAKRGAFLFSRRQAMSPFISEILNHGNVSAPLSLKNTHTRNIASGELGQASTCPKCGDGTLQIKTDKKGANKPFLGCSKYPSCRHTVQLVRCPKCNSGKLVRRVNRQSRQVFYPCSSFDCDFRYKNTGYKKP